MSDASSNTSDDEHSDHESVNGVPERTDIDLIDMVMLLNEARDEIPLQRNANDSEDSDDDDDLGIWGKWATLNKPKIRAYLDLALSATTPEHQYHIKVNPHANQERLLEQAVVERDIDSVLVFSPVNPWRRSISVIMCPYFYPTLGKLDVQVNFAPMNDGDEPRLVDPGKDAAILVAECGDSGHHNLYIMLPAVREEEVQTIRSAVYLAMRKSVKQHVGFMGNTWPASLASETDRARGFVDGRATRSTRLVASDFSSLVLNTVLDTLRSDYAWGRSAYVFLQMRGVKDLTKHGSDRTATVTQIDSLLLDVRKSNAHIFLDVAVQIEHQDPAWSILPRSDDKAHMDIISSLFRVNARDLDSGTYNINPWCCLQQVGGADMSYKEPLTQYRISKAQVYSSDKFYAYNASIKHTQRSLHINGTEFLEMNNGDKAPRPLSKVYNACLDAARESIPCTLRVEIRVPLDEAARVFRRSSVAADLNDSVFLIPTAAAWAWRMSRCDAIGLMVRYIASTPGVARSELSCLTLTAVLSYVFNSIHSRPANYSWQRIMALACFPTGNSNNYDQSKLAYTPRSAAEKVPLLVRGALLLLPVSYPSDRPNGANILCFRNASEGAGQASEEAICKYFGKTTMQGIKKMLNVPTYLDGVEMGLLVSKWRGPARPTKKRRLDPPNGIENATLTPVTVTRYEE
ncbi:hypothetical protein CYLTODRAFT_460360, partial [Cylindrobasidium torrendii FP15055 ss-10]